MTLERIDEKWVAALDTPALLVDLQALEVNLRRVADELDARGVVLRPHFKTHKTIEIAELQRRHGAIGQ